jgi:hypothetical protein
MRQPNRHLSPIRSLQATTTSYTLLESLPEPAALPARLYQPLPAETKRFCAFESMFAVKSMTVVYVTTKDHNRVKKIREWARQEFALTDAFYKAFDTILSPTL